MKLKNLFIIFFLLSTPNISLATNPFLGKWKVVTGSHSRLFGDQSLSSADDSYSMILKYWINSDSYFLFKEGGYAERKLGTMIHIFESNASNEFNFVESNTGKVEKIRVIEIINKSMLLEMECEGVTYKLQLEKI